jgi:hypothetical protein
MIVNDLINRNNASHASVLSTGFVYSPVFSSDILYNNQGPDAILCSSDRMCFYTHTALLLSASSNNFGGLIHNNSPGSPGNPIVLSLASSSEVLDISLRVIYLIEFPSALPPISTFESAIRFLNQYGITPVSEWIAPASHIFSALISLVPQYALDLYALAAEYEIEPLAAHASSFLLELSWNSIPEETAERIGGLYMKRLGNLQISRTNTLKVSFFFLASPRSLLLFAEPNLY